MNIVNVFKDTVGSFLVGSDQDVSEKLIELATFFYKVDRRVSLEEQAYIDELLENIEWNAAESAKSFQRGCVAKVNTILGANEEHVLQYLSTLMQELEALGALDKARSIAKEISDADGEIADDEVKYLDIVLSYK